MKRLVLSVCAGVVGVVLIAHGNAWGADPESAFGATNVNAEVGNGGLSAGISQHGTITILRWPSPSYYDQLNYKTATQGLTPSSSPRTLPHFGAADNMGSFAGLYFTAGMPVSGMVWLRDPTFTTQQYYVSTDSDTLVTQYTSDVEGVRVTQYDLVMPDRDVLVRHYVIDNMGTAPMEDAGFVYYENLAPCLDKTEYVPVDDWSNDAVNDYACLYDSTRDQLVHFMPGDKDFSHIMGLFSSAPDQSGVDSFLSSISSLPAGVYAVIGFDFKPDSYQVGSDATTLCPSGRGVATSYNPQDAYVSAYGGTLPGSPAAQCQANAAVTSRFSLASQGHAEFTVYLSFAKDYSDAEANLSYAQRLGWQTIFDNTEAWWKQWLSTAKLPNTTDPVVVSFSKRALISIRLATDNGTGAIVASISTQPPYAEDWPRDGSFINYALDVAGYHSMVTKHELFYAKVQRKAATGMGPAGSFDMNFYADGMPGGPIPFEIDETGLAVWTMWVHTEFLGSSCDRLHYMQQVWPAIKLGTQALVDCKDSTDNLQCYANEDDNVAQTQGLQGAITTWLGIESGIAAARYMDDAADIPAWQARADELKQAIVSTFFTSGSAGSWTTCTTYEIIYNQCGSFTKEVGNGAWSIWPAEFLPYTSSTMISQGAYLIDAITPDLTYQTSGTIYNGKATLALAVLYQNDPQGQASLDPLIYDLLHNVPTQDTQHMGEVAVTMYDASGKPY
ncbi:MAG: hypothetical protein M1491_01785, partial [Deltaproteobacteria bacterium]|nr:hypothetical protein [Deltaproteobacteria bacterium]